MGKEGREGGEGKEKEREITVKGKEGRAFPLL